ncbi:MAG: DUF4446 family protein [Acidimicrobiia bacterium]|nr:DUF4446 family protein [Acidimicrobiia bacterium]
MTEAAIALAILAIAATVVLAVQLRSLTRRMAAVPKDGDVVALLGEIDTDLAAVEQALAGISPRVALVENQIPLALSHVGVVTYDAFGNIAGQMSRSIAVVDQHGDGVVISVLVGRNETLFFAKQVVSSRGAEELSPEEQQAVEKALAR